MKIPTNHQIVSHNGTPVAAVIPYADYLAFINMQEYIPTDEEVDRARNDPYKIPHAVVVLMTRKGISLIRAWREHKGLTQKEIALRIGVKQSTYAHMESGKVRPRISTLQSISQALGIHYLQLDLDLAE
jgi:DNA-binding XRE family transcriptional regulator